MIGILKCEWGELADGVRFELTKPFGSPVFKTGAFNHSATHPTGQTHRRGARRRQSGKCQLFDLSRCFVGYLFPAGHPRRCMGRFERVDACRAGPGRRESSRAAFIRSQSLRPGADPKGGLSLIRAVKGHSGE